MITLSAEQIEKIYRRVFSGSGFPPSDSAFYRTVQSTIEEINRIESPEPISTPRIATVTDLGNDTYQLVIQNGTSIMSATLTTPQFLAWELKEANR